ncbi:MAG: ATP-grasp domain-containing protein [Pirellulales bacterium]|nr:ATP-grasp domain-containing protein [Pirellulales bacterium]
MQVFVYEWATGGGLVEEPGPLPASLLREGGAMIGALVRDLHRIVGTQVMALRDPRVVQLTLEPCEPVEVLSRSARDEQFDLYANQADATVLIAPEFDNILLKLAKRVEAAGGRLVSPASAFIRIAADKHRTCQVLEAAGVPVPVGCMLDPEAPLPADFPYPAVVKPADGAGSQDTYFVRSATDTPPAYAWRRRLERYVPGLAASTAVLSGPAGSVALSPCVQRISQDGRFRYLGGELPLAAGLAERARALALKAVGALPRAVGYVGVDLVLGSDPAGSEDFVIEINPRLTTSYVGLRAAARTNLAEAMCRIASGETVGIRFSDQALEFDPAGNVSYLR